MDLEEKRGRGSLGGVEGRGNCGRGVMCERRRKGRWKTPFYCIPLRREPQLQRSEPHARSAWEEEEGWRQTSGALRLGHLA